MDIPIVMEGLSPKLVGAHVVPERSIAGGVYHTTNTANANARITHVENTQTHKWDGLGLIIVPAIACVVVQMVDGKMLIAVAIVIQFSNSFSAREEWRSWMTVLVLLVPPLSTTIKVGKLNQNQVKSTVPDCIALYAGWFNI